MKPGRIQVFDGLRVTTEHLNHFQDSLQSALDELRVIVGVGQVHRGYEVEKLNETTLRIQPGVAFDRAGRRMISDDVRALPVAFSNGGPLYVVLQHQRVEDGVIENTPTLIWDEALVSLADALPGEDSPALVIASLEQDAEAGTWSVLPYPPPEDASPDEPPADGESAPEEGGENATGVENGAVEEPAAAGEASEAGAAPENEGTAAATEGVAVAPPDAAPPAAPEEPGAAPETRTENGVEAGAGNGSGSGARAIAAWPAIRQGVVRVLDQAAFDLSTLLLPALTRPDARAGEIQVSLGEKDVPLPLAPASLTCQTLLAGSLMLPGAASVAVEGAAQGEATRTPNGGFAQYGITRVHVTEQGIAEMTLAQPVEDNTTQNLLSHLHLLVQLQPQPTGFRAACRLVWRGETGEAGGQLQHIPIRMTFTVTLAYKVIMRAGVESNRDVQRGETS